MSIPLPSTVSPRLSKKASRHIKERVIEFLLFCAAAISVFTTFAIVYVLLSESWHFFEQVPLSDFLFDTQWTPLFDDAHYGIMVLLSGTLTDLDHKTGGIIPGGDRRWLYRLRHRF